MVRVGLLLMRFAALIYFKSLLFMSQQSMHKVFKVRRVCVFSFPNPEHLNYA